MNRFRLANPLPWACAVTCDCCLKLEAAVVQEATLRQEQQPLLALLISKKHRYLAGWHGSWPGIVRAALISTLSKGYEYESYFYPSPSTQRGCRVESDPLQLCCLMVASVDTYRLWWHLLYAGKASL